MKIVEVTKLYTKYLEYFYNKNKDVLKMDYSKHLQAIFDDCNAQSNFLDKELELLGYETELFYYNATELQFSWNKELNTKDLFIIVKEQIKQSKPDVLFISDLFCFTEEQLKILKSELSASTKFVAWHFGIMNDFSKKNAKYFDQIYTGSKYFVKMLSEYNRNVKLLYHTFSPSILEKIEKKEQSKTIVFSGSISLDCQLSRLETCANIINAGVPFIFAGQIYGTLIPDNLYNLLRVLKFKMFHKVENESRIRSSEKAVRKNMISSKFGIDYYQFIADNLVCINKHADIAGTGSGNMRMTEVTGVGSCLLTDHRDENKDLFETDYEIVEYSSRDELIEKAKWLIDHPIKAKEIAIAGQQRTLRDYTYKNKAEAFLSYLNEII